MTKSEKKQAITFKVALRVADKAVFAKISRHFGNIEVAVLRGALLGQRCDQIADEIGYVPEYSNTIS